MFRISKSKNMGMHLCVFRQEAGLAGKGILLMKVNFWGVELIQKWNLPFCFCRHPGGVQGFCRIFLYLIACTIAFSIADRK